MAKRTYISTYYSFVDFDSALRCSILQMVNVLKDTSVKSLILLAEPPPAPEQGGGEIFANPKGKSLDQRKEARGFLLRLFFLQIELISEL